MTVFDGFFNRTLAESDAQVARGIAAELVRQREQLELIASENLVSRAVLEAQGSVLTNKYAEGYPGKRYYGGCEHVDVTEQLAIDRAKQLFGAEFANVQPHSGAQANMTVLFALLTPGDTILGMSLAHGGHLTHGAAPTVSGRWFKPAAYGVSEKTQTIDYDEVERIARETQPKLIIAGGSAIPRTLDFARFRRCGRRLSDGRYGPYRRSGGGRRPSQSRPPCPCGHRDHPQDLARPARRPAADQ